jgi:hypothetical protein
MSYVQHLFDMDSNWLDRLDMGFDFSDILSDSPGDGKWCPPIVVAIGLITGARRAGAGPGSPRGNWGQRRRGASPVVAARFGL